MCQNNCGSGLISNNNLGAYLVFYKTNIKETSSENSKENKEKGKYKKTEKQTIKNKTGHPLHSATAQLTG